MKLFRNWLMVALLFACLSLPVLADNGRGQVVYPGGSVVVESGEVIHDDVVALGGSLDVREGGRVDGNVILVGGSSSVDGQVDGNLVMVGGSLDLGTHAVVDGDLVTLGGSMSRSPEATIRGETIEGFRGRFPAVEIWRFVPRIPQWSEPWRWGQGGAASWFGSWVRFLMNAMGMMALGLLLVYVLPKQTSLVAQTVVRAPAASLGVGLLTLLLLPIVLILLVVICIGIPVAILLILAAVAAGAYGWVAVGTALGQRLLVALKRPSGPAVGVIVGVGLLSLLSEVPCLGWLLGLIVASAGLGAVVLTRFGTLQYVQARQVAPITRDATGLVPSDVVVQRPQEPTRLDEQGPPPSPGSPGAPEGPVQG